MATKQRKSRNGDERVLERSENSFIGELAGIVAAMGELFMFETRSEAEERLSKRSSRPSDDHAALRRDMEMIGNDLRAAFRRYEGRNG